ncbi:LytTR family DNA-binding domain-containing protein [Secundilactobacillus folii]|uniref:HTH LytTR-type domain-containing protein n=1 Tax=Secundilactobacillus folii TaxID=2678357 RepID=A0A7X2XWK4_9LACO|nr:LytTR family DNA-binding domain-containing protein [Secundilactobacillus folii]MTV82258.1 hypothetical protein [Secundilactobacillus folii]
MNVIFNLAEKFAKPFISINAQKESRELVALSVAIDRVVNQLTIIGYADGKQTVIPFYQITRFYTQGKHVVCETGDGAYKIHERMYELRERLAGTDLIPVSNAEIVNKTVIKSFQLTKSGSYQINLTNGDTTFSSRRFVKYIREAFLK